MDLNYTITPSIVEKILFVTHKGKKRDFQRPLHIHLPLRHEMFFVDYGKMILTANGVTSEIGPGECIFIPGAVEHAFTGDSGSPFNYLNIMFRGEVPQYLFGKALPVKHKCMDLIEKLKQESTQEYQYCHEIMGCCLTELIYHLLRQVEFSVAGKRPEPPKIQRYQSDILNRAMAVVADRYSTHLSLKQISRAAGIGESRLRQLFKIETGENFTTLLHRQRIAIAQHLLCEGVFSLKDISNAVGYQSTSFFFKVFKRVTGMTPKTYSGSLGEPAEKQ